MKLLTFDEELAFSNAQAKYYFTAMFLISPSFARPLFGRMYDNISVYFWRQTQARIWDRFLHERPDPETHLMINCIDLHYTQ